MNKSEDRKRRLKWFINDRYGMFIHWGIYAIPARGEWVRSKEQMPESEYMRYFNEFDASEYNPKEWARLAKESGMKYAVFTTKHHDGFCMFDSKYTDFKSTNTPAGRDLVREFVDAFRAEGLKIGLYYSLNDWHHPEYPAKGDRIHPSRNDEEYHKKPHDFRKYLEYYQNQVRELLTNYGKIDIIWFDGVYDDMVGEAWDCKTTEKLCYELQPDILINDRLTLDVLETDPEESIGDYYTPELIIPTSPVVDVNGNENPWEICLSLNGLWCYDQSEKNYMDAKYAIRILVECVSKGGNILMNMGPDIYGRIPKPFESRIREVGEWLRYNGKSIYGCGKADFPKPEWGWLTQNGKKLYAHVTSKTTGSLVIPNIGDKVKCARFLSDGVEINIKEPWNGKYSRGKNDLFLNINTFDLTDDRDTVIEIELK